MLSLSLCQMFRERTYIRNYVLAYRLIRLYFSYSDGRYVTSRVTSEITCFRVYIYRALKNEPSLIYFHARYVKPEATHVNSALYRPINYSELYRPHNNITLKVEKKNYTARVYTLYRRLYHRRIKFPIRMLTCKFNTRALIAKASFRLAKYTRKQRTHTRVRAQR